MEDKKPLRHLILLTGTPLSNNIDVHGYTKLLNRNCGPRWENKAAFLNEFAKEINIFKEVVEWKNHEDMQDAFMFNAVSVQQADVLKDLEEPIFTVFEYALSDEHQKIYRKVATEKLLEFEGQKSISFDNSSAAAAALQQVVIGVELYAENEAQRQKLRKGVAGLEVIDNVLGKVNDNKLIIFAYYEKSIEVIMQHLAQLGKNPAEISGRISNNQRSIDKFKNDDSCKVIVIQISSGGAGLEFQDVCHKVLFMEFPKVAKDFRQAVARVHRKGQSKPVHVWVASAVKTVQVRQLKNVMRKDEEVNKVQVSHKNLKEYLYGDE